MVLNFTGFAMRLFGLGCKSWPPPARRLVVCRWPARQTIDLPNRTEMIRQVRRIRHGTIQFDLIDRVRSFKRILSSALRVCPQCS